jgi:hypothetical protein
VVLAQRPNLPLTSFEGGTYSQNGEEGLIAEILRRGPHERYAVEIGAWDGVHLSNTRALAEQGYRVLLVEADGGRAAEARDRARHLPNVEVVAEFVRPSVRSLEAILDEAGAPTHPALVSIDVDSTDYLVMESLGRYRTLVICVEINMTIPNHIVHVQRDEGVHVGNSARALVELGDSMGYGLVHANPINLILALRDEIGPRSLTELSIDEALDDSATIRAVWVGFNGVPVIEGNQSVEYPWSHVRSRPLVVHPEVGGFSHSG